MEYLNEKSNHVAFYQKTFLLEKVKKERKISFEVFSLHLHVMFIHLIELSSFYTYLLISNLMTFEIFMKQLIF